MATKRARLLTDATQFEGMRLLDELIRSDYERLLGDRDSVRMGEWLKMIELRAKLQPGNESQAELWRQLEEIRQKHLPATGRRTRLAAHAPEKLIAEAKKARRRS